MHQALYRKWRPKTFSEVCGQEHITSILKQEATEGKFNHAYLFCGSRGTGKTTCAKILSKVVNCENVIDGNPCAVLFEADPKKFEPLNGANVTSSDRIVLIAEMQNPGEPTEWERFEIPFEPKNGKEFDYEKLANNEYAITVVASSSKDGAFFEGAIGSTLLVDEIRIVWEQK